MAPAKSHKRGAAGTFAGAQAEKRVKPDPQQEMLREVAEALSSAENLAPHSREFLKAVVPSSLGPASDERHASQTQVVEMIGEALVTVRQLKEKAVAGESEKVASIEGQKAELEAAKAAAQSSVEAKAEATRERKEALVQAEEALGEASKVLVEKQEANTVVVEKQAAAEKKSQALDGAMTDHFSVLKDGQWDDEVVAREHIDALAPFIAEAPLDQSLANSFPMACMKKVAERSNFDTIVLEQFEKVLSERATGLRAEHAEFATTVEEHAAAVQAAEAEVSSAQVRSQECSAAVSEAEEEDRRCEGELKAGKEALKQFLPEFKSLVRVRNELQAELDLFCQGPIAAFESLRDRSSAAKVEAEVATATAAAEAKVEAMAVEADVVNMVECGA